MIKVPAEVGKHWLSQSSVDTWQFPLSLSNAVIKHATYAFCTCVHGYVYIYRTNCKNGNAKSLKCASLGMTVFCTATSTM